MCGIIEWVDTVLEQWGAWVRADTGIGLRGTVLGRISRVVDTSVEPYGTDDEMMRVEQEISRLSRTHQRLVRARYVVPGRNNTTTPRVLRMTRRTYYRQLEEIHKILGRKLEQPPHIGFLSLTP